MQRTINGRRYLMRDNRPVKEIRKLYQAYITKYRSTLTIHQWMVRQGKVYYEIR